MTTTTETVARSPWYYPLLIGGLFVTAAFFRYIEIVLCLALLVGVFAVCVQAGRKGGAVDRTVAAVAGGLSVVFAITLILTTHWR